MKNYLKQYEWSDFREFLQNEKRDPEICADDFQSRLVVISGATSGIGYETAKKYASHGADILSINRNEEKSIRLCNDLKEEYAVEATYLTADFTRLADVHVAGEGLASLERDIDVLIHNAGVYLTKKQITGDNLEVMFQTIYLSSFILNHYLFDKIKAQDQGRIIFVSSEGHRFAIQGIRLDDLNWQQRRYSGSKSYGSVKTAQLLSMLKLSELYSDCGVTVNAMHPGNVKTNMGGDNGIFYQLTKKVFVNATAKSPQVSAEALYSLGVDRKYEGISGKFFNLTTQEVPAPPALDKEVADELWDLSLVLGGLQK